MVSRTERGAFEIAFNSDAVDKYIQDEIDLRSWRGMPREEVRRHARWCLLVDALSGRGSRGNVSTYPTHVRSSDVGAIDEASLPQNKKG